MQRAATEVMQSILFSAVLDAVALEQAVAELISESAPADKATSHE